MTVCGYVNYSVLIGMGPKCFLSSEMNELLNVQLWQIFGAFRSVFDRLHVD